MTEAIPWWLPFVLGALLGLEFACVVVVIIVLCRFVIAWPWLNKTWRLPHDRPQGRREVHGIKAWWLNLNMRLARRFGCAVPWGQGKTAYEWRGRTYVCKSDDEGPR